MLLWSNNLSDCKKCRIQGKPSILPDRKEKTLENMHSVVIVAYKVFRGFYTILKGHRSQQWGKIVTECPKIWNEHSGSIRNSDIQKEPARLPKRLIIGFNYKGKRAGTVKRRQANVMFIIMSHYLTGIDYHRLRTWEGAKLIPGLWVGGMSEVRTFAEVRRDFGRHGLL